MSPNRIVALLTPLVFAPLAGACAAWLAENFPGVEVDPGSLQEIFIAGALIALAPAAQWLHGWQKHEARQAELERDIALAQAAAPIAATVVPEAPQFLSDEEDDFEEAFDDELGELDAADELGEVDDELDELDELDALGDLDEEELLLDEEDPVGAGS